MQIAKYGFPPELYYDRTHNWARVEGDLVIQGLTAFGQALAGEIIYVEPAAAGRKVKQGQPILSIESGKWVGRINAAVSGQIVAFNVDLEAQPELVNKDPYGRGWMVRLQPDDLEADLARLLRPDDDYQRFVECERQRYGL
ncbi:MAG: glycine cleavage system protein H [Anaerolineae bacterium]